MREIGCEFVGEGAALRALGIQGGLGPLGARDRGVGKRPCGIGLCLAGCLDGRDFTGVPRL
ncbi:MAG: hypothetical protein ACRDOL_38505 [Streptosporangiaceae bacterium]